MFLENLSIYNLISESTSQGSSLERFPVYIHFVNAVCNHVPEFLSHRREIGIVIQKQFENLIIDYRGLSVTLFFDGKPHAMYIELSTIYSMEIVGKIKLDMDNRLSSNHINNCVAMSDDDYMRGMKEIAIKMDTYEKEIVKLLPKQKEVETKKITIFSIEDIIKPTR